MVTRRRRVFLDAGGHDGETLMVVQQPRWGFDRIWTFEPTSACVARLEALADERTEVVAAGLWSCDALMDIHDPGTLHASVDATASRFGDVESCRFIDAATWMGEHVTAHDEVWMKINVEAAEIAVLDRLLESGEIATVDHLVVHFDAEKVGRSDEADEMRRRLDAAGVPYSDAADVMFGRTVEDKTICWLTHTRGGRWSFVRRRTEHRARALVWRIRRRLRRHRAKIG